MYQNLPVRIHAVLADGGQSPVTQGYAALVLWYGARALDVQGKGYADIDLHAMATALDRSVETLRRYLRDGVMTTETLAGANEAKRRAKTQEGQAGVYAATEKLNESKRLNFFRSVTKLDSGLYRVYPASLKEVCRNLGIRDFGAVTEITVGELRHMKSIATEVEAQRLQKQSRYAAQKKTKKGIAATNTVIRPARMPRCLRREVPKPSTATDSSSTAPSFNSEGVKGQDEEPKHFFDTFRGRILNRGARYTYVDELFVLFGSSQENLGNSLGRHARTVRRRLSHEARGKAGLPPIQRRQIAHTSQELTTESMAKRFMKQDLDPGTFFRNGKAYRVHCNVYSDTRVLIPMRITRTVLGRLF